MAKFWPEHQLLAFGGSIVGGDIWTCTLKTVWNGIPGQAMSFAGQEDALHNQGVSAAVVAYFGSNTNGASFRQTVSLEWVKFNSIGVDGRYKFPNTSIVEFTPGTAGLSPSGGDPRESLAVTLRTAISRGRGATGRFYPPPQSMTYAAGESMVSAALASAAGGAAKTLVAALNAVTVDSGALTVCNISPGDDVLARSVVTEPITTIEVDRVMDTQRRRSNKIPRTVVTIPL